jgi:sugar/nucleoside kinase (ribokinase family)
VAEQAARTEYAPGQIVSIDPGSITAARGLDALAPLLARCGLFFSNEHEIRLLTGVQEEADAARAVLGTGPAVVVIKSGADGCRVYTAVGVSQQTGFKVNAIDSTGAGDAFDAAFITALLEKRPLRDAARFACAVGALTTTHFGAQAAQPSREQICSLIQQAT